MSSFGWLFLKTAPLMAWNDEKKPTRWGPECFEEQIYWQILGPKTATKKWRIWENPNIPLEHTPRHPQPPHDDFFHKLLVLDVWGMFHGLVGFFSWEPLLSLQVTCETPQSTQRGLLDIGRQKPFRWVFHLFWRLRTCLSLCESTHPSYSSLRMKQRVWNPPVCLLIWSYERTTYEKKYFFPAQTG